MGSQEKLAGYCSLCGDGYHPNLEIDISEDATSGEFRWCHVQCSRDHDRDFVNAFGSD